MTRHAKKPPQSVLVALEALAVEQPPTFKSSVDVVVPVAGCRILKRYVIGFRVQGSRFRALHETVERGPKP